MSAPDVAALYVRADGPYAAPLVLPGVDAWDVSRDARAYAGDLPVVAHPPCARWGRYATVGGRRMGDDGGCGTAAVEAVQRCGGVLEHPAHSRLWDEFGLPKPGAPVDWMCGYTVEVEQGWFGHLAPKRTWLYVVRAVLPPLPPPRVALRRVERLSHRQRELTPPAFAAFLVDAARTVPVVDRILAAA